MNNNFIMKFVKRYNFHKFDFFYIKLEIILNFKQI
jgi:hypothetical protein